MQKLGKSFSKTSSNPDSAVKESPLYLEFDILGKKKSLEFEKL